MISIGLIIILSSIGLIIFSLIYLLILLGFTCEEPTDIPHSIIIVGSLISGLILLLIGVSILMLGVK